MDVSFKIGKYAEEIDNLKNKIIKIYENYGLEDDIISLEKDLKSNNELNKISVAFVGQYSAGKSTIIKGLTGNYNIKIDSDIATSKVESYNFGNISLIDTPGLNTNEHKEHDEATRNIITKADLLVYCITSDLFREVTKNDFKS